MKKIIPLVLFTLNFFGSFAYATNLNCDIAAAEDVMNANTSDLVSVIGKPTVEKVEKSAALALISKIDQMVFDGVYSNVLQQSTEEETAYKVSIVTRSPGFSEDDADRINKEVVVTLRNSDCSRRFMLKIEF